MLSDEEKISLNRMKLFARSSDLSVVTAKDMDIVVTLVEKQQKEIEELNIKILSNAGIYQLGFKDGQKSVNNKIKAKIEEYEKEKELYDKDEDREWGQYNNWDWVDSFINEMQSLLGKE